MTRTQDPPRARNDDLLLQEAARWRARLDLGDDAEAFALWRDSDPRRAVAFARVSAAYEAMAAVAPPARSETARISRRAALAAGLGVLALGGGGALVGRAYARDRVRTLVGERRQLDVPELGSITLNTDSLASWRAEKRGVQMWLERGEIAIDLAADARPFRLHGGEGAVRLKAGRYNARLKGGMLDLIVLRGEASTDQGALMRAAALTAASAGAAPPAPQPLSLLMTAGRPVVRSVSPQDIEAALAWRNGEIVFLDQPLASAVEEYNRYLVRKILILDPELGGIRVGGRFTSNDPAIFLEAIHTSLRIDVVRTQTNVLLARKNS